MPLGDVDVISGGAITNAALYALRRMPWVTAELRIIEPELLDLTNLNRYALARRSCVGMPKIDMLASYTRDGLSITGVPARFDGRAAQALAPIARRVLVGVDHIPSRWLVQAEAPRSWIGIGASSHDFVLVSAHPSGAPCVGCVHPKDDEAGGPIPTISFVSFWAGLIQALDLSVRQHHNHSASHSIHSRMATRTRQPPRATPSQSGPIPGCPLHCRDPGAAMQPRDPAETDRQRPLPEAGDDDEGLAHEQAIGSGDRRPALTR